MSQRSEPKEVCRRNALGLLGYAAAFGLVASSAVLTASQAEAQTPTTPTTPPADRAKSGTEGRQERRTGRTERRAYLRAQRRKALERAATKRLGKQRQRTGGHARDIRAMT
jgi:hypothetical protein